MFFTSKALSLSHNMLKLVQLLMLILLLAKMSESVSVMSIDLGAEFLKIAIVKPGVPMEIVLNKESRRKTPLAVSIRSVNDREFGEMAMSQAIKKPKTAYLFITQLLAKSLDSAAVKSYKERYPFYDIREDPITKTVYFQHDESTKYTPEELLAMILDYARELAADFGEQAIDAAVIAVPPYFNQAERKAVLRAAEMINLKVLQLINTNIAAGLNYGVFRRKDFNSSGTTLMFYDMGSSGTTATVATFQMVKNKDDIEANPQLTVRGIGFDRNLGGNEFTMRLARHLAKLFMEKTKKDVFKDPKAINKLYKEADRVKNVLSANVDHVAQVEGLMDDVDFKAKVTREEFEALCADLFERVKKPINDAIKSSEILHEELTSVILVGGGTRIPKVQDELLKATKKKELGKNLNTDEAPALGAVYQCAYQSKGYKVKKFHLKDVNAYPIVVDFERFVEENEVVDSKNSKIRRVLFDKLNPFPQKKVMTFSKHTKNFDFSINYGDLSFYDEKIINSMGSLNISQVSLNNIEEIFKKHENEESKGIKVHFRLDESGILKLDKIDIAFEKLDSPEESTLSKIGNTISSFFGSSSNTEETKEDQEKETTTTTAKPEPNQEETSSKESDTKKDTDDSTTKASNATLNATETLNDTVSTLNATKTVLKEEIKFENVQIDLTPIEKQIFDDSVAKLQLIKEKEKEKRKRAMAFNSLETFIFDTRDKLSQEEFIKASTEEERENIAKKIEEVDMWLSDSDDTVETKMFTEKLTELKNVSRDVFFRLSEKKLRPKKLDELKDVLNKSMDFFVTLKNMTGEDLPLTETERATLEKLINSTKEWRVKMLNEQAKVAENETPKLLSADISDKIDALKREVNYLVSKIKYFRPKTKKPPVKKPTNSTSSANKTETESDNQSKKPESENANGSEENPKNEKSNDQEDIFDNTDQDNQQTSSPTTEPTEEDIYNEEEEESTSTPKTETTNNPEL